MICKIQCVQHHTNQWATPTQCSIKSSMYNRQAHHPLHAGKIHKAQSPKDFTTPDINPTLTSPFTETNMNVTGSSTIVVSSFTDDTGHNSWSESGSALITCKVSCKTSFIVVTSCYEMYQVFYFVQGPAGKCQFGSGSMWVIKAVSYMAVTYKFLSLRYTCLSILHSNVTKFLISKHQFANFLY